MIYENYEIGIPELMKLYYDVYDEQKGDFTSMSEKMREMYEKNVAEFYKAFTGKDVPTDENGKQTIKTFSQIPLRDYNQSEGCKPDGIYTKPYEGSLKSEFGKENLFANYAKHVNVMMNTMNTTQDRLVAIIKKLFKFTKKDNSKEEEVTVHPDLDETLLQTLVNSARNIIVELYIRCEADFLEGLHIFESIVALQLGKTTESQIDILNHITTDFLVEHSNMKV